MKKSLVYFLVVICVVLILPIFALNGQKPTKKVITTSGKAIKESTENEVFKIKLTDNNKIVRLSVSDYLFGCIAGEMPITYNEEALKAQGIASYTYALRKKESSDNEYDLTDDYRVDQCYLQTEAIKEKWGENYDEYSQKLRNIVDEIKGYKVTYKGETALTVYHAISNGRTLSAKEVWGKDIPYLCSVDSSFDKLGKKYQTVVSVPKNEFLSFFNGITGKKTSDIASLKTKKSENGRVSFLYCRNEKVSSEEIVKKYSLRSSSFDVKNDGDNIVFIVLGYGHGVGMSQNGADCMAENGSNFKEILLHYYKGCTIEKN